MESGSSWPSNHARLTLHPKVHTCSHMWLVAAYSLILSACNCVCHCRCAVTRPYLYSAGRASNTEARSLRQRQAEIHELVKGVAKGPTGRALQGALQLPCKDVLDDAAASAVSILPCLISLFSYCPFPFQLLVRRLALYPVQLCLHAKQSCHVM